MGLHIKDPTAHELAQTLARETGETMTQAVAEAILERLERIGRQRKPEATVAEEQAHVAHQAYADFGKGRHPAGLNFGDCFSYALAKVTGESLLFKGNDFKKTDVVAALDGGAV